MITHLLQFTPQNVDVKVLTFHKYNLHIIIINSQSMHEAIWTVIFKLKVSENHWFVSLTFDRNENSTIFSKTLQDSASPPPPPPTTSVDLLPAKFQDLEKGQK